jgi:hypothetical protein
VLLTAYAYLASFQVCLFFSSAFVVRNLFDSTPLAALLIAVAVATGFFVQYVFDINAGSHLVSIAIATLAVGLFTMQITGDHVTLKRKSLFPAFAECLAGLIFIFVETMPINSVVSIDAGLSGFAAAPAPTSPAPYADAARGRRRADPMRTLFGPDDQLFFGIAF